MATSPNNTRITSPGQTLTDTKGAVWSLIYALTWPDGLQAVRNNKRDVNTRNLTLLMLWNGTVWNKVINTTTCPSPGCWFAWLDSVKSPPGRWLYQGKVAPAHAKPAKPTNVKAIEITQRNATITWQGG